MVIDPIRSHEANRLPAEQKRAAQCLWLRHVVLPTYDWTQWLGARIRRVDTW
jgi:hypothetical protein